jgi:hypothetical protein
MLAYERPKYWNKPGAHPERGQYAAAVFSAYGSGQPLGAPASPAGPSIALPQQPAPPLNLAPQDQPIFAQSPQAADGFKSAYGGPAGGGMQAQPASFDQMQAPPIFFAKRKPVDLSKLREAFQAPTFSTRG